jgi:hypothetical protein
VIGTYVPAKRTPVTPDALRDALRACLAARGVTADERALTVLVAMSAHETGEWRSCWNYNLGNVKAGETWPGLYTCLTNVWEVLNGVTRWFSPRGETAGKNGPLKGPEYATPPGHPQTRFRAYSNLVDGVDGFAAKMTGMYRKSLDVLLTGGTSDAFVASLKRQRYFTGDLVKYQASVRRFCDKFGTPARRRLELGTKGDDVAQLQKALGFEPTGVFDARCDAAVRQVQDAFGLVVDGVVGRATWPYIDKVAAFADVDLESAVRAALRGK